MSIDIWIWVLHLPEGLEIRWDHIVALGSKLHKNIVFDVSVGEIFLVGVSRVCVSEHSVSIPWDNLTVLDHTLDLRKKLLVSW